MAGFQALLLQPHRHYIGFKNVFFFFKKKHKDLIKGFNFDYLEEKKNNVYPLQLHSCKQ